MCRPISSRLRGGGGKVRVVNCTAPTLATAARSHKPCKLRSPERPRVLRAPQRGRWKPQRRRRGEPAWGPRREAGAAGGTARAAHGSRGAPRPRLVPHREPALPGVTGAMHPRAPGQQGPGGSVPGRSPSAAPQPGPSTRSPNYNPHHPPRGGRAVPSAAAPRGLPGAVVRPGRAPPRLTMSPGC